MKRLLKIALFVLLAIAASCERRPLEYYYNPTCKVVLTVDWTHLLRQPTGMTAYFYRDGYDTPISMTTADIGATEINLPEGHYRCFVMNQSPNEFWTLGFNNMDSFTTARADIVEDGSKWFVRKRDTGTRATDPTAVGRQPEDLAIAVTAEFDITEDMVERYQEQYAEWKTKTREASARSDSRADLEIQEAKNKLDGLTYYINTTAYNTVSELKVRVYVDGIYNLYSARASMDGLALGYMLYEGYPSTEEIVQLMETWTKHVDDADPTKGYIESSIRTFGLPGKLIGDLAMRSADLNLFSLECLLVDLTTRKDQDYNVGNKFTLQLGIEGLKLALELELGTSTAPAVVLPDVPPAGGSSGGGFDATVSEWQTGDTVEIPM